MERLCFKQEKFMIQGSMLVRALALPQWMRVTHGGSYAKADWNTSRVIFVNKIK